MKEEIKQRRLAVLEETVQFYSADPSRRAKTGTGCHYITNDGRRCAIGRLVDEDLACRLEKFHSGAGVGGHEIFEELPQEIKDLGLLFLARLQNWHDDGQNWHDGLTEGGKNEAENLKRQVEIGDFI